MLHATILAMPGPFHRSNIKIQIMDHEAAIFNPLVELRLMHATKIQRMKPAHVDWQETVTHEFLNKIKGS